MATDEMTTGRASLAKAVAGATATPPGSPLLAAYEKWKAAQGTAPQLGKAADAAADLEARALRKSRKRLRKHLLEGVSPARAAVLAHTRYKLLGGRSGIEVWSKKVQDG